MVSSHEILMLKINVIVLEKRDLGVNNLRIYLLTSTLIYKWFFYY